MNRIKTLFAVCAMAAAVQAAAQTTPVLNQHEVMEVTATKIAEDVVAVPSSITIVDGDDIRARNAHDLASALSLVGGLSIAPGGDSGPAGSVPEMWGLREFDAFLLVVDGVPWGGAFNPDLPSLDLENVDRIEILRGAAPVMYGATSFVGVIHVIHLPAGAPGRARLSLGNYSSGSASVWLPLSQSVMLRQSLGMGYERRGFRDDGTHFDRSHLLYRLATDAGGGTLRLDGDVSLVRQDPGSPHPREGKVLSPEVPLDANFNPANGRIDQNRYHGVLGYDTKLASMPWSTTLALTHSSFDIVRGFLLEISNTAPNSSGFTQDRGVTDLYFDTHVVRQVLPKVRVIAGFDHLYGRARTNNGLFDYFVPLSGASRPQSPARDEESRLTDRRNFSGLYASGEWSPLAALRFDAGLRLNHTSETQHAEDADGERGDARTKTRASGALGANWRVWTRGDNALSLFANYRNTFKPAAIDFGPEAEGEILNPETAHSVEAGVKGRAAGGHLHWDASVFKMDFSNLVVSTIRNGQPAIENAGKERFRGGDLDLDYQFAEGVHAELGYSYHDARFRDYAQNFDGVLTQLAGRRLEMSPFNLLAAGLIYAPEQGFNVNVTANYAGPRFLNRRNTALAGGYTTWSAGAGYRIGRGELRVDGRNLRDVRPPVSESELGDAQYYRLPARSWEVSYRMNF